METQIVVSTITICGSLGTAIIALLQSTRAQRAAESIKLEMENLKTKHENQKQALAIALREAEPLENAVSAAWSDIQRLKDILIGLLSPARSSVPLALAEIEEIASSLTDSYATFGPQIPLGADKAWHKAKAIAQQISLGLGTYGKQVKWGVDLPPDFRNTLCGAKESFTDLQLVLANERRLLRELKMKEIRKLL